MDYDKRIKAVMKIYGLNQSQLAQKLEVHPTSIGKIIKNLNTPNGATLSKLLEVFPDIRAEWLMRGEGEMTIEKNLEKGEKNQTTKELKKITDELKTIKGRLDKIEKSKK